MSASIDLTSLRNRVKNLEAALNQSKADLDYAVAQAQECKDQYNDLQDRHTALEDQCTELQLENKRLTRRLTEPNAYVASPAIASQSDEVAPLRQQLAEKDQVIKAQDERYQSLLTSIKPVFNALFTISSMLNGEAIQSSLAAMPRDAAKMLETLHKESAQGEPPSDGDADSQEETKPSSERPTSRSEGPDPVQQPESSIAGPVSYSDVVTSKRAELQRRGRPGQPKVPVSHEDLARKEALRAEKREEIQSSAGRSQKSNKIGAFRPTQKATGSSDITALPVPKHNVTSSQVRDQPLGASFLLGEDRPSPPVPMQSVIGSRVRGQPLGASFLLDEDRPSPPVPKKVVTGSQVGDQPLGASYCLEEDRSSSPVPKEKVLLMSPLSVKGTQGSASKIHTPNDLASQAGLGKTIIPAPPTVTNPHIQGKSKDLKEIRPPILTRALVSTDPEQSSHQVLSVDPLASRQARAAGFPPPARSWEVPPEAFSFNTVEDDEEPYLKALTRQAPLFLEDETDTVPQESVTQKPTIQVSAMDTIDTPDNVFNWASETEEQASDEEQRKFSPLGKGKIIAEGHTQTLPRGQGQSHHQGRGRGGLQAPPSHSNPENYILNGPWRGGNAAREACSPSPEPMRFHETWRKTVSSNGTRKVVSVQKSESLHDRSDGKLVEKGSVMGGEEGVASAKQAET